MALVRPTGQDNVVPATVAAIDQLEKLTGMLNILLAGGVSQINVGTALIHWPGGSAFSTGLTVTHGMSVTPKTVMTTINASGTIQFVTILLQARGPTTFQMQAGTTDGSSPLVSDTTSVEWFAIG